MIFPWMSSYPPNDPLEDTPIEKIYGNQTRSARRLRRAEKNRKVDPWEYDEAFRDHMQNGYGLSGYDPSPQPDPGPWDAPNKKR